MTSPTNNNEDLGATRLPLPPPELKVGSGSVNHAALPLGKNEAPTKRSDLITESADRFREFFENSKDAIYVHDLKGRYTMVNPAAEALVGYTREELLRMTIFDLVAERYFDQIQNSIKAKLVNHAPTIFDLEMVRKDGTHVPVEVSSRLIYENDLPVAVQGTARDISERQRVEEALRDSEERFRIVTETASDAIIVISEQGTIELANPSTQKIFGYSREELLGQNLSLLMPARFHAAHCMGLERYVNTGLRTIAWEAAELSGLRRDGTEVPLELSFGSFTRKGRQFFTGIIRDISERKRVERALQDSEERFRGLFENAKDTVFTCDLSGNFTSLNRAGEILTEYTREEALQSHFTRVVADEYLSVAQEMLSRKATGSEIAAIYELEIVTRSGRHVLVEIGSRTIHSGGQPVGVQGNVRDITERKRAEEALKRSEEQYRILFESNPQPMWVFDLETSRFLALNEAAVRHYGYSREHFLMLTLADLHPPEDAVRLAAEQLRKIEGLRQLGEWRHRTANGEIIDVEITANVTNFGGRRAGLLLINDITEHQRAEEALRASQAQLQQSQKLEAIGQLAGGVAHDFNNLLTAITGYTDLSLRRLRDDDPIYRNLEEIRRAANRAASLTRRLLAFSRKQILDPKVLDLNVVVKDMYKMLRRLIGEDIDLATRATFELGKVKADPSQVEQVILNLVVNARDALPHGGKITIETADVFIDERYAREHVPMQTGDYVMLAISDTGCGMDQETQAHIFEPFYTTKEAGRGTGLGLSTVYGIVKQSGGFIWVDSELGKGTSFKIYLPLVVDEPVVEKPKPQPAPTDLRGHETILLVEDEDVVRRMARLTLESRGYRVLEAREGEDALRVVCEHAGEIDLMLTDVIMPGMSGRMLAERIAVLCPELPVLYMSGYTDDAIVRHGLLGDQLEFIKKPFAPEVLTRKVRSVLDTRAQRGVGA